MQVLLDNPIATKKVLAHEEMLDFMPKLVKRVETRTACSMFVELNARCNPWDSLTASINDFLGLTATDLCLGGFLPTWRTMSKWYCSVLNWYIAKLTAFS